MPCRLLALATAAQDPPRLAEFWSTLLGAAVVGDAEGSLIPGNDRRPGLRFVRGSAEKQGLNRVHLHLTSTSPAGQQQTVMTALALGANHLDVGQRPEEGHVVLADPEGNEFCVIEAGNSFLEGCGFLGELACDGTREVGLFWSAALGWPLVWDQNQETAIQSPHGGPKVAWGGPPLAQQGSGRRQRFDLALAAGTSLESEVARLIALGAIPLRGARLGSVALSDPDGDELRLIVS